MELYKYCKAEHRDGILGRGSLRVGTLHDYRRTDVYGERVADINEGKKTFGGEIAELTAASLSEYPGIEALGQSNLIGIDLNDVDTITDLVIKDAIAESPNLLIFSTSEEYSEETHDHWRTSEGYDACYKITSARLFFRAISNALGAGYSFLGFGRVIYEDSLDLKDSRSHVHPAMIKRRTDFLGQAEIRALWKSTHVENLSPILLERSSAGRYAMPYRLLPSVGAP